MPNALLNRKTGKNTLLDRPLKPFDPEGGGYDFETALKFGITADETGHWPSREPTTGILLKGKNHPTWHMTEKGEKEAGYTIKKIGNRYFSFPN